MKLHSRSQNKVKAMDIILSPKKLSLDKSHCTTFMFNSLTLGLVIFKTRVRKGDKIMILEVLSFKPCDFTPQESEMYVTSICYSYIHTNI